MKFSAITRKGVAVSQGSLPCALGLGFALVVFLRLTLFLNGEAATPDLLVYPSRVSLQGADDRRGILVSLPGEWETDVTSAATLSSRNPKVVEVGTNGICRPVADGTTEIEVKYQGRSIRIPVDVHGAESNAVPSFRQEIEPILTRLGCNQGACHGKLAGQNGFRLSLRGYAPEMDYRWLTEDVTGRRIDPSSPEESLLLTKPLGQVPHEGLVRFVNGSRYHDSFYRWIAARCPAPLSGEAEKDAVQLKILPGDRRLAPGMTQRLLAQARWPDGHSRDVTWLTQFFSNDEATASVTPEGLVTAIRNGETSIRAHFQGLVQVIRLTIPYQQTVEDSQFAAVGRGIDSAVFAKLKSLHLPPSPLADDVTFLRRSALDATGTLPEPEAVRAFLGDERPDKRQRWIAELLERPEFTDYWTLQLADLLQNRKERDHDVRGKKGVRAFHAWLREQIAAHRPWDQLARDILTVDGDAVAHPAIGYYVTLVGEKEAPESEVTDSVAQAFMGTRIGCARCHNHPLERYTQDDFYHFAAFFSRLRLDRKELSAGSTVLEVRSREEFDRQKQRDEHWEQLAKAGATWLSAETPDPKVKEEFTHRRDEYARLKRESEELARRNPSTFQPRTHQMVEARALDRSAILWRAGEDPRKRLADWLTSTNNEYFAEAMVNRLWKHYMGVGLVEPVDDLRASNPPSNPELMRFLRQEFVAHGYDLRYMMALILNSRAYQLSSETTPANETDRRFYSHYYARRLPAEVLSDAVSQATGVPDHFEGMPVGLRAIQLPEPGVSSYFLSLFGRSDRVTACACERMGEVTLPQLLHLQNGEEIGKKIWAGEGRLQQWSKQKLPRDEVIRELYWVTVNRAPNDSELEAIHRAWGEGKDEESLKDLFWALLNAKEFAFNH
jgi:hypothetical protein